MDEWENGRMVVWREGRVTHRVWVGSCFGLVDALKRCYPLTG